MRFRQTEDDCWFLSGWSVEGMGCAERVGWIVGLAEFGSGDAGIKGREVAKDVNLEHAGQDVKDTLKAIVSCLNL